MLSLDYSVIVIFIFVWILVYALNRVFFKPVRRIVAEREHKIQKNQESREKSTRSYEQSVREIEENLKAAQAIADKTREELERKALLEKNRLLEEISAECRIQADKAKKQLKRQMKSLKKELESESEVLAERIEKRILQ